MLNAVENPVSSPDNYQGQASNLLRRAISPNIEDLVLQLQKCDVRQR